MRFSRDGSSYLGIVSTSCILKCVAIITVQNTPAGNNLLGVLNTILSDSSRPLYCISIESPMNLLPVLRHVMETVDEPSGDVATDPCPALLELRRARIRGTPLRRHGLHLVALAPSGRRPGGDQLPGGVRRAQPYPELAVRVRLYRSQRVRMVENPHVNGRDT